MSRPSGVNAELPSSQVGLTRSPRLLLKGLVFFAIAVLGLIRSYQPTIASGFRLMQPDPGDSIFLNYVLEHGYRAIFRAGYPYSYWSPGFFYPQTGVLSYSETLAGTLPVYAGLRLFLRPDTAFQAWMIVMSLLSYVAFVYVGERLAIHPILSSLCGFIYAFGMCRVDHLGHFQLAPAFPIPLAILVTWRLLMAPKVGQIMALILLICYQLLCSVYLGWFLALGILWIIGIGLTGRRFRGALWRSLRGRFWVVGLTAFTAVWVMWFWLRPYRNVQKELGGRPWAEVSALIPTGGSWFTAPRSSVYGSWLWHPPQDSPFFWEHVLFPGIVPVVLFVAGGAFLASRRRAGVEEEGPARVLGLAVLGLVVTCLQASWATSQGRRVVVTLWRVVFDVVPGGEAIRVVGRVWTVVMPLALLCGAFGLSRMLRERVRENAMRGAVLGLLVAFGIWEQGLKSLPTYDKLEFRRAVDRVARQFEGHCQVGYVRVRAGENFVIQQLVGMWAGLEAGIPVVNGYSGNRPEGYGEVWQERSQEEVERWMGNIHQSVCVVPGPKTIAMENWTVE